MRKNLLHFVIISGLIKIFIAGIFRPYSFGEYDPLASGISLIFQFINFTSLLLVPIGLYILLKPKLDAGSGMYKSLRILTILIFCFIILSAILASFASKNQSLAVLIFFTGLILVSFIIKYKWFDRLWNIKGATYFIVIPLTVFGLRMIFLEDKKDDSIDHMISNSSELINDIESYKKRTGQYPISLHSTVEDYRTGIAGISRFLYEPSGDGYNLFFIQQSDAFGTEEVVMYNPLDQQEATTHNQDLLRVPSNQIYRGYHDVKSLNQPHWKIFYFD